MKTAIILAVLCALTYATPSYPIYGKIHKKVITDKVTLQRQMDIFHILRYIHQPTYYEQFVKSLETFSFDHMKQYWTGNYFIDFMQMWKGGVFLARGEVFSIFDESHLHQVKVLFNMFFYAKDYDSFFKMAIWCRNYINEGMFLYTFSTALIHRPDCHELILPPIYEIYPYYFVNSEVITKAHTLKQLYGTDYIHGSFVGKYMDFKGDYQGFKHEKSGHMSHVEFVNNKFVIHSNYSGWHVKSSTEQKMSYFTEDVGGNSFYYYYNLYFPYWMNSKEYNIHFERRGEYVYYFFQQLLAFYYMNRLSNNLVTIDYFDYDKFIKTGYQPTLNYPNGLFFPVRKENSYLYHYSGDYTSSDDDSYFKVMEIKGYERRIMDAIDLGFIYTNDGTKVNLYSNNGLNYLGNLIEGNADSVNQRLYGSLFKFFRTILGYSNSPTEKNHLVPSVMEHLETSFRDPVFYQFFKRILFYFQKYKNNLPKYTYNELYYGGVTVEGVQFEKLYTYFENFDLDLTNAMYINKQEYKFGGFPVKARYQRFTYKPFSYRIMVNSKKADKVVVRTFLAPKFDEWGNKISMLHNYYNFIELDQFVYSVKIGKSEIVRNSNDFYHYVSSRTSYKTLYYRVMRALKNDEEFVYDGNDYLIGRPKNFILPMGKAEGMEYQVYVYIYPFKTATTDAKTFKPLLSHAILPIYTFGSRPYGFPLDRPMSYFYNMIPNSFMTNVYVYSRNYENEINKVPDY